MDDLLSKVVKKLTEKTEDAEIQWEDITSSLIGRDVFRTKYGDVFIQLSEGTIKYTNEDSDDHYTKYYKIEVHNRSGFIVAESRDEVEDGSPASKIESLFKAARASAREQGGVLEKLLVELGK